MRKVLLASLLLVTLFGVRAGRAQQPVEPGEAVWSLDFVKVKPGMFEQTMSYFDEGWIPAREEAKRRGVIIGYRRIAEMNEAKSDWDIILMTEYKNQRAYDERDKAFGPIDLEVLRNRRGTMKTLDEKYLYDIVDARVLRDFSQVENPHFKLIGKL
jgi:hypothetical protein